MARLRLTPSNDGVDRATLRVEFRIDRYRLTLAALWELEQRLGELCKVRVCDRVIADFTREGLLAAARSMYRDGGYSGNAAIGEDVADGNEQRCEQRVAVLFPEFD